MNEMRLATDRHRRAEGILAEPIGGMAFDRALGALRALAGELGNIPLPSDRDRDLEREVARYRATGKIIIRYADGSEIEIADPPPAA